MKLLKRDFKEKPLFIVFEGPEGSGKTTIMRLISDYLNEYQVPHICTREPGGVNIAEQIRGIILDNKNTEIDPLTEALLYTASRRQHLVEKVIPALNDGKLVLCDRFVDSSIAYQGYARGIGVDLIKKMNKPVIKGHEPDLVIYFDVEPEIGLSRIENSSHREINRLDVETLEFHKKVCEGYRQNLDCSRTVVVDANKSTKDVYEKVKEIILKKIEK